MVLKREERREKREERREKRDGRAVIREMRDERVDIAWAAGGRW
jgi:hypothetical protein